MRELDCDRDRDRRLEADDDEIEILEVVGLDEDVPAAAETEIELEGAETAEAPPLTESPSHAELLIRLRADFDNYKRRVERDREATERQATAGLVMRLLPVLDNFERALSTARRTDLDDQLYSGVALIFRQLLEELRHEGLEAVDSVGEPFDPAHHEAVATTREGGLPPHTVVEELQRGYCLNGRLLRPALVRVALAPGEEDLPGPAGGER